MMKLNNQEIHSTFINSVRYSLTRHTYAAGECVELLRLKWEEIPENTRRIIIRDVDEAIRQNAYLALRWPDDIRKDWESLRDLAIGLQEKKYLQRGIYEA